MTLSPGPIRVACAAALLAGGCFDPNVPAGLTCGEDGLCPAGQVCDPGTNTCQESAGARADAAPKGADASQSDAAPSCSGWTAAYFDPCELPPPSADLVLDEGSWLYDTDTGTLSNQDGPSMPASLVLDEESGGARVLSLESFLLDGNAQLRVVGSRPLIIASFSSLRVRGILVAGSAREGTAGAGADPISCSEEGAEPGGTMLQGGGGGGGGGGFGGPGGRGATAGEGDGAEGGAGGAAVAVPEFVRGGCPGAHGGGIGNDGEDGRGAGGSGGGAVALAARTSIDVSGTVDAGGAGGEGGGPESGGGGGGSGGLIALDSPSVVLSPGAVLTANGGGGGGGGDTGAGQPGQNALPSDVAAQGGPGDDGEENAGGDGSAGATLSGGAAANEASNSTGGGGGGGGAGYLVIRASSQINSGALTSPPPSLPPTP